MLPPKQIDVKGRGHKAAVVSYDVRSSRGAVAIMGGLRDTKGENSGREASDDALGHHGAATFMKPAVLAPRT